MDGNPESASRGKAVFLIVLMLLPAAGILYLTWKDINSPVPAFAELKEATANGFRADIAREVWGPTEYSIEFHDGGGRRYQIRGADKPTRDEIASALERGIPVTIRYDKWQSQVPSATIFTVYQVEVAGRTVIPYSKLAQAKQREQANGPWIMLCIVVVTGAAAVIGIRRGLKIRRTIASLRPPAPPPR